MGAGREASANPPKIDGSLGETRSLRSLGLDRAALLKLYRLMVFARLMDEAEVRLRRQQKTYFEISCAGHEAIQAAAALLLRPGRDWFYPYYRDRVFCLGIGVRPVDMLLQSMGRATDPSSGGREMPAHYGSRELHIVNQSSPTGTQYLHAVGTAEAGSIARAAESHAAGHRNGNSGRVLAPEVSLPAFERDELVYVSGGEGSTSEGEFYEAISLASLRKLPVLFVIQDNEYAISVPVEHQTPGGSISTLVRSFPHFLVEKVNGFDIIDSFRVLRRAVAHVRAGRGPALVHARVVRLWPHSDSDDDRLYRTPAEREADRARDPIPAYEDLLLEEGYLGVEEIRGIRAALHKEVEEAVEEALPDPFPDPSTATFHVYNPRKVVEVETEPEQGGPPITLLEAIQRTLELEMARDPRILVFGEDVADLSRSKHLDLLPGKGGVFKVTHGLQRKFGDHRVFNTPIGEAGIAGRAFGLAVRGFIPVAEIQFLDYIWPAMQQIRNELGMVRWRSNNVFTAPVVLRVPTGGYLTGGGPYHSQSAEAIFCHCPGLRIVLPSNARDAAGLLRTALRCGDPVLFLEHKHLYRRAHARAPDPGPDYVIPLGVAALVRKGTDATVITYGALVDPCLRAAEALEEEGLDVEVIDLRSLQPYDWDAVSTSIRKTNRAVVIHEDTRSFGFGAELAARIAEELFSDLDAPVMRLGALDAPVAYSPPLEHAVLPQLKDVVEAIRGVLEY